MKNCVSERNSYERKMIESDEERETKRREMNAKEWMERRHGAWEFVWDIKRETQPKKESIMSI